MLELVHAAHHDARVLALDELVENAQQAHRGEQVAPRARRLHARTCARRRPRRRQLTRRSRSRGRFTASVRCRRHRRRRSRGRRGRASESLLQAIGSSSFTEAAARLKLKLKKTAIARIAARTSISAVSSRLALRQMAQSGKSRGGMLRVVRCHKVPRV